MTTLESKPSKFDNVMYVVLGIVFVAFLIYVPFMIHNKQERLQKAWNDSGYQMYDDYKPADVPAKCSMYLTDHYQPQKARVQPLEAQ